MNNINFDTLSWEDTAYNGIQSYENKADQLGDKLRYFKITQGAEIPSHSHLGYEKIILLNGKMEFLGEPLNPGDILYALKNEEHSAIALEDTLMLVINQRL